MKKNKNNNNKNKTRNKHKKNKKIIFYVMVLPYQAMKDSGFPTKSSDNLPPNPSVQAFQDDVSVFLVQHEHSNTSQLPVGSGEYLWCSEVVRPVTLPSLSQGATCSICHLSPSSLASCKEGRDVWDV
ncbi:hypothetical protein E2C01_005532 [Portunus trituberculatus]|uniref:Uncharacterized protein n=1 Tax=Portunus trituberculatus TaxID=210409 RepID=A0A5B7CVD8_PORTR|nr:hypothetical protein [Portunus trituberculatus]